MDLNDIFTNVEVLQAIATLAAAVTGVALMYVITLWSLAKGAQSWRIVRGQMPAIRAALDEPTDPANVAIDRVLDRFYTAQWENMAAVFLPKFVDGVASILDAKLAAPPQEINITGTTASGMDAQMVKNALEIAERERKSGSV